MRVLVPTHLRSYTGLAEVDVGGATLGEAVSELDRRYPGLKFRMVDEQDSIREHIAIFVNMDRAADLGVALKPTDRIKIVAALSGG